MRSAESLRHFVDILLEIRLALRTYDLAELHRVDRRFIRDAQVEIAELVGRPMEQQRPQSQVRGSAGAHRHPLW